MSATDINKVVNEDDKTLDKKQIEAEEKEVMLKESEATEVDVELRSDGGPVKTALSGDITEQGREVKPKFIPIGAIKMPGFFTRNSDREKSKEEEVIEKDIENEKALDSSDDEAKLRPLFQFLSCPFSQLLLQAPRESDSDSSGNRKQYGMFHIYSKKSNKQSATIEVALASVETLEDKLDTPNDGMETVKLDISDEEEGTVATKLPLKERIRQGKFGTDDLVLLGVVALVLMAVITGIVIAARVAPPNYRPLRLGRFITTQTSCGLVEGVPYAVPPIEERRFTYAQPLNDLSLCWNGTLQVHKPGPLCMQILENGSIVGEEDCLTLDIVTPHVRYDLPLPVVVLIGANTLAGGIGPAQPSSIYAARNEVVFVRPNFRLGAFGFLALDILSESKYPPSSGNYGLSDLVVALQWIQYNIKNFGGDPESVTLLGHRAGATLTAALTTVRKAHRLFSRTWLSSPSVIFPGEPLDRVQKNNEQFKSLIDCHDVECLRRATALQVMAAIPDTWLGSDAGALPAAGEVGRSWLVLDGDLLRTHAYETWDEQRRPGSGKDRAFKPMVFGTSQHSAHSDLLRGLHAEWTPEAVERAVSESALGERNLTGALLERYGRGYLGLAELTSAVRTLCPLVSLARMRLDAPLYVVTSDGAGEGVLPADVDADVRAVLGAEHSEAPRTLRFVAAMQRLFYYFVWHGRLAPGTANYPTSSGLLEVGQDAKPLAGGLPACDLLIREDVVPRFAHVD